MHALLTHTQNWFGRHPGICDVDIAMADHVDVSIYRQEEEEGARTHKDPHENNGIDASDDQNCLWLANSAPST